jgi:TRAP-type C4-dicarboxylate transport system permease large subunit
VPEFLGGLMRDIAPDPLYLTLGMLVVYLFLGCFLDPLGMMLLTLPVFLPMMKAVNMDLIWLGILLVKYIEIGLITPPVGLNVYGIKVMVPDIPLETIFKGAAWFLLSELVIVALLIAFPQLSLWLPGLMS